MVDVTELATSPYPLSVVAVQLAGLLQSIAIIKFKPWNKSPKGAWDAVSDDVVKPRIGPPQLLLAIRTLLFVYCFAVGARQYVLRGPVVFKFFTVWNWWLLVLFFGVAAATSWRAYLRKPQQSPGKGGNGSARTVSTLEYAAIVLFNINMSTVQIVDVLTWTLLWPMLRAGPDPVAVAKHAHMLFNFSSYNMHGANALFILTEALLTHMPCYAYLLGYVGLWGTLYGGWSAVFYIRHGVPLYPFLDVTKPWAPYAFFGVFMTHWLAFFSTLLVIKFRDWALAPPVVLIKEPTAAEQGLNGLAANGVAVKKEL